jgi:hypothetical protein
MDPLERRESAGVERFGHVADAVLEARISPRVAADLAVELYSREFSGPLRARTRDLSVTGVCVATRSIVSARSIEQIVLRYGEEALRLPVEGRWQSDSPTEGSVLVGLSFGRLDSAAAGAVWSLVQEMASKIAQFISQSPTFAEFSSDEALSVAQMSRFVRIQAGRPIYVPGHRDLESIFVVSEGQVGLHLKLRTGEELTLARLGPGGLFGGLPLIAGMPNLEMAAAQTDVGLLEISHGAYSYARLAKPILAQRLTQAVARGYAERVGQLLKLLAARGHV